jgi:hypothetical protein
MSARRPARRRRTDVHDWASQLDHRFLMCRTLRHVWAPTRVLMEREGRRLVYVQVLTCSRCETERVWRIDDRGHVVGSSYAYPDGFAAPAGSGFLDEDGRADLRLLAVTRLADAAAVQADARDELADRRGA